MRGNLGKGNDRLKGERVQEGGARLLAERRRAWLTSENHSRNGVRYTPNTIHSLTPSYDVYRPLHLLQHTTLERDVPFVFLLLCLFVS
jgi:hypothetical protein